MASIFVTDRSNARFHERDSDTLAKIAIVDIADGEYINDISSDGENIYVLWQKTDSTNRLSKYDATTLLHVQTIDITLEVRTTGSVFSNGLHVFVGEMNSNYDQPQIVRYLCSDLSFVDTTDDEYDWDQIRGIDGDTDYIYFTTGTVIKKLNAVTMATEATSGSVGEAHGIAFDGTNLYVAISSWSSATISKYDTSFNLVLSYGTLGSGDEQYDVPRGICTDGTSCWVCDQNNYRIKKISATTLQYEAKIGSNGSGDDQFNYPMGITFGVAPPITTYGKGYLRFRARVDE